MLKSVYFFSNLGSAGGTGVAFDSRQNCLNGSWINLWQNSEEKEKFSLDILKRLTPNSLKGNERLKIKHLQDVRLLLLCVLISCEKYKGKMLLLL